MSNNHYGPQATINRLQGLVRTHGAVMIEHDPRGFRVVLADQHVRGDGTTWNRDEVVARSLSEVMVAATAVSEGTQSHRRASHESRK